MSPLGYQFFCLAISLTACSCIHFSTHKMQLLSFLYYVTILWILSTVWRLNGVFFLVLVFEELFHVTSPFWSRDNANPGIHLFYEKNFISSRPSRSLLGSIVHGASPFYKNWELVSCFNIFALWTFLHVPWTLCDFFVPWGENLVPSLFVIELNDKL